ncbi:hypothetical protein EVAR_56012_1 [Eumeta japonica]|uniref:Uncharacterized protein n=1 Tax=Eumeta variegata TaxID=151549 RepID=A0A4C1YYX2_EUMVA|nr:hypothetical protein EVAR_56012_1 [Eumeta japonica]
MRGRSRKTLGALNLRQCAGSTPMLSRRFYLDNAWVVDDECLGDNVRVRLNRAQHFYFKSRGSDLRPSTTLALLGLGALMIVIIVVMT